MNVIKMDELEGHVNRRGVTAKPLLKKETVQIMNLILESGDYIPEHSVPVDVFFYVVEGKGTINIGGEEKVVEAGDIIPCSPDTKMSLHADQGVNFKVLNVKTPAL